MTPIKAAEWLSGSVSHSGRVAGWLSGWGENFRHCALNLIFLRIDGSLGLCRSQSEAMPLSNSEHLCQRAHLVH